MIHRAPHTGTTFRNNMHIVWDIMSNICGQHECLIYIKPAQKFNDGRKAYELLFDQFIGPNRKHGECCWDQVGQHLVQWQKENVYLGDVCLNSYGAACILEWPEGVWILWN
jgi:hypothetical protein